MNFENYFTARKAEEKVMHLKLMQFWDDSVVHEIGPEFVRVHNKTIDSFQDQDFVLFVDLSEFGQPTKAAQHYISICMNYTASKGLGSKVVELLPKMMVKLSMDKAAQEGELEGRMRATTREEALEMVEKLKSELD